MKPSQRHLIVFARAPRMGRAKRRLARDIGTVPAWALANRWLTDLYRRLGNDPRWVTWLAITPDVGPTVFPWPGPATRQIGQGTGDLGQRMGRVIASRPPGHVILIGSDIPSVTQRHIARAFKLLAGNDAVFGPTPDGGYWLVGLNRRRPLAPFTKVRWSSPHARADSLANLRGRRVALADELDDIDDADALRRAAARKSVTKP